MQRFILALLLLLAIGGLGYFFVYSARQERTVPDSPAASESAPSTVPPAPLPAQAPEVKDPVAVAELPAPPTGPLSDAPLSPGDAIVPGAQSDGNVRGLPSALANAQTTVQPPSTATATLDRSIGLPIAGLKAADVIDTFNDARGTGERRHEATDIMAARGTPVIAVDTGLVKKLFDSKIGGLTVYQFDSLEQYCYYYAHLDRYAEGLKEGMLIKRGDKIGYVGSTGNAETDNPHLHFGILKLGPEKKWWEDTIPVNPYPVLMRSFSRK